MPNTHRHLFSRSTILSYHVSPAFFATCFISPCWGRITQHTCHSDEGAHFLIANFATSGGTSQIDLFLAAHRQRFWLLLQDTLCCIAFFDIRLLVFCATFLELLTITPSMRWRYNFTLNSKWKPVCESHRITFHRRRSRRSMHAETVT